MTLLSRLWLLILSWLFKLLPPPTPHTCWGCNHDVWEVSDLGLCSACEMVDVYSAPEGGGVT